ncbi:hypothetical protein E3O19_15895 [Cryobacterium algoritolerans]|uniref:Uncharacterized protein n=1 Tax=Cryobacterium algoritolerans TaxID=1259184 RepID=A0A4R8WL00_9MICO|nr:hypothetical protein [Cryobacterium algoritolerans]TFC09836.1 hypothetical protein E3O19_15895 [Cryobacterium algoritolerans]
MTNLADGILLCAPDDLRVHNEHWRIVRTGSDYSLIPLPTIDPSQTPIRLASKSALKLGSPLRFDSDPGRRGAAG